MSWDRLVDTEFIYFFFFKQKTAYDLRISDWSSDVCSSDLEAVLAHGCSLLVKGGHAEGETVIDRLLETGEGEVARWEAPRIDTKHSHGTGCTLASAIACGLAQGMPLDPAIAPARDFVRPSRAAERRLGKEWVRTCMSWWSR